MKWLAPALVVLIVAGSGGIAYACGGGGGGGPCGDGSDHHCPSLDIVWKNPSGVTPGPYVQCVLTLTSPQLTVVVGGLAPGTGCTFFASLANVGEKSVSLTENVTITAPSSCTLFNYTDNLTSSTPPVLRPGASYPFQGSIGLAATAGNACQGATATILVVITGSEAPTCHDHDGPDEAPLTLATPRASGGS